MGSYILSNKEELQKAIEEIESLETRYLSVVSNYEHQNCGNAINAYRAWYNKVAVVINSAFGATDEDVKEFRGLNNNCNGYGLFNNYMGIEGTYSILKERLKSYLTTNERQYDDSPTLNNTLKDKKQPTIFISHAGNDKQIIDIFIDRILKGCIGLKDENIICTSFEKNAVSIGNDIPLYIKEKISDSTLVISAVSQNYKASEVCMNEVGAA